MNFQWTYSTAKLAAKKYDTLGKWSRLSHGSYDFAKRNNYIKIFSRHMKKPFLWSSESVKNESLKYKSKKEWAIKSIGSYQYAVRNKLLKEFSSHMINPRSYKKVEYKKNYKNNINWTVDSVWIDAKKYKSRNEWKAHSGSAVSFARRNGFLQKLQLLVFGPKKRKSWNIKLCKESALKRNNLKEWKNEDPHALYAARKNKWFKQCSSHFEKRSYLHWNKISLKEEMKKYKTRKEFIFHNRQAYHIALKTHKKLMDKTFPLIESQSTSHGEEASRRFLEEVFEKKFKKQRTDFLKNPKTGHKLELDGFCPELKIAFEFGDHSSLNQKMMSQKYLRNLKFKDSFKKKKCYELGIRLLQLTKDPFRQKDPKSFLKNLIQEELARMEIPIPKKISVVQIEFLPFKQSKITNNIIWGKVKKSKNMAEFQRNNGSLYTASKRLGLIDDIRVYFVKKGTYKGNQKLRPSNMYQNKT